MSEKHRQYVTSLQNSLDNIYAVAKAARQKGLDSTPMPEPEIARDLADLVEGLVGPPGVASSIRELSKKLSREGLAFKVAGEIVSGEFGSMDASKAAEQAVRTALAILTEGITAAPLQGVANVAIKSNMDKTKYLAIYFAGPIRSAGGTEQALTLVVGDFVRRLLGLERYKPTKEEIERFVEEVRLCERSVTRFQYHVSDEELKRALENIPVEVTGTETSSIEVSSFRNLLRIETNRLRGGALRVVNDGVVGRSAKVLTLIEKLSIEGWDWLKEVRKTKEKKTVGFMEDVIAGRPIFSFPSRQGGFRLRYGRARNTGLAAVGLHPATMIVLQRFLAAGTQLRLEGPGKAGIVLPVDLLEPPIVRLKTGSLIRVSLQDAERIKNDVEKILFLGDILVSFGDFLYNNKNLLPSGLTEEWWCEELRTAIRNKFNGCMKEASAAMGLPVPILERLLQNPFQNKPTAKEAILLASSLHIPLHPFFTYFWSTISSNDLNSLRQWTLHSEAQVEDQQVFRITGALDIHTKGLLEKLCVPHRIVRDSIVIEFDDAHAFSFCLGFHVPKAEIAESKSVLDIIYELSGIIVREKAPTLLGARMGRPEKAKRREMKPLVHVLFPIGLAGGVKRNLVDAKNAGVVEVELTRRRCLTCKKLTFRTKCPKCGGETLVERNCPQCGKVFRDQHCPICRVPTKPYENQLVDFKELISEACQKLKLPSPSIVKGVKGLSSETKTAEIVEKGILRAKYDLSVFKDGTIRFDATNAPLTHFKASEIDVTVEKLVELGYDRDHAGNDLKDLDQVCELKVQDVIIPRTSAEYFVRVANFLDTLLERVYGLSPYYSIKDIDGLVGHLVVGLAPHTLVGIIGRIIGFTDLGVCYAHPLWHSAKRRDCDGDEDTLMLALDTILNFSKIYLPSQIGGIMDAPIFIIPSVNPLEVQRQAHEIDVGPAYSLSFYEKTLEKMAPREISDSVDLLAHRLNSEAQFEGFSYTIPVLDINAGNRESSYKKLGSMIEKLNSQLSLAEKIEAVDAKLVARKVLTTHFIRDILGNLRAFTTQSFRCKACNRRFRRLPLQGKCPECNGVLTLTVYRGGIEKYLEAANQLVQEYGLPKYYTQRLKLVKEEISSLFEGKGPKQATLTKFFK